MLVGYRIQLNMTSSCKIQINFLYYYVCTSLGKKIGTKASNVPMAQYWTLNHSCHRCKVTMMINILTHWGRVTHLGVSRLTIIGSDNGLPPDRRQAIVWTNAGILLIGPLGTNFSEILIEILIFSFKKIRFKVSSAKRRPFSLSLNVLNHWGLVMRNGVRHLV